MCIRGRAGWLHYEDITATNVLVYLKVEFAVRETLGKSPAHITTQVVTNLFRQLGICISGKDLYSASSAHKQSVGTGKFS
jgi:hypothetical protein